MAAKWTTRRVTIVNRPRSGALVHPGILRKAIDRIELKPVKTERKLDVQGVGLGSAWLPNACEIVHAGFGNL